MIEVVTSSSKQSILDAAQKLLVKYGYAGLSMRELSEECGLAKATIYHYFRDKQEIVLSVLERDMTTMRSCTMAAAAQEENCIQKLRAIIHTHYVMMLERHAFIINVLREINGLEPQLRELKHKHIAAYCNPIAKIIEDGIAQGVFRPLNVEMTVFSLFGMINSFVVHCMLTGETEIGDDFVEHTLSLFLHGVSNDGGVSKDKTLA
jgi:AcrR family transcriptional regulator